jgi:hypothetical protein
VTASIRPALGILYAGQQRLEHMVAGFRAKVAAEFGAFRGEVDSRLAAVGTRLGSLESDMAEVKTSLTEIFRRLPGE